MKGNKIFKPSWDRISAYLPVILMLIFAMFTYWLLQVTPKAIKKEGVLPLAHVEDYFMRGFAVTTYETNGEVKSHILGSYARHFADTDTTEIEDPRVYSQSHTSVSTAQRTLGTAKKATTNADASLIELRGDVELTKQDWSGAKALPNFLSMKSQYLKINSELESIYTNLPVQIDRGEQKITADSMQYNNLERRMQLVGNVKVTFAKK